MRVTSVTVYWYSNNVPQTHEEIPVLTSIRCTHCGKVLARAKGRILSIANTKGPDPFELPPGVESIEIKCRYCNTVHNIIWQ